MWWAEAVGLEFIAERMAHYAATLGNAYGYWTPAKLLSQRASSTAVLSVGRRDERAFVG